MNAKIIKSLELNVNSWNNFVFLHKIKKQIHSMITFPCAKINLGLNIISERNDGYHNIETIFYPIPLTDVLEINSMSENFPSAYPCDLKITGNNIECDEHQNLVIKAYNLITKDFNIPHVHAHLYKRIPSKAGLGGGSSDGAFMIRLLNERYRLNIKNSEMERYATILGADCAFFITAEPSFGTSIGNELAPVDSLKKNLNGYHIVIVKPSIEVSTKEAYRKIIPKKPIKSCREIVHQPINTWKEELTNDFETPVFNTYPELKSIKEKLYNLGASYAQMSGSGSSIFGIFIKDPKDICNAFPNCYTFNALL